MTNRISLVSLTEWSKGTIHKASRKRGPEPYSGRTSRPSFSILENPLSTKEERPWHARMCDPETDTTFPCIVEVLMIEQVDDVESHQHLLLIPRKIEHVRN